MIVPSCASSRRHLSTLEIARDLGVDRSPSSLVKINEGALAALIAQMRQSYDFPSYQRYTWSDSRFWFPEGTPADRSQYFAVGNAINFRFWNLDDGKVVPTAGIIDGEFFTGAMYMWRCLQRCLDRDFLPVLDASFLATLSVKDFDAIFGDDDGLNPLGVAKEDRVTNLRDLGSKLARDWQGSFYEVVAASGGSLLRFVGLSAAFRAFDDPLFKLTMVNTILHLGSGITDFDGEPLPGIDYHLLKQVLRQGVLVPRERLAKKLRRQQLLSETDAYELRRTALNAFVELSARTGLSGEILDNKWWLNRVKCRTLGPVCLDPRTAHECPFFGSCAQRVEFGIPLSKTRYY